MSDRLEEAARLYLENIAVLKEAHDQLAAYLGAVWESCWDELQTLWKKDQEPSGAPSLTFWKSNTNPGRWHIYFKRPKRYMAVEILVDDPRRTGDPKHYLVHFSSTVTQRKKLQALCPKGPDILVPVAEKAGMSLLWEDPHYLHSEKVSLVLESSQETAGDAAEAARRLLQVAWEMEQVVEKLTGKQSPAQ